MKKGSISLTTQVVVIIVLIVIVAVVLLYFNVGGIRDVAANLNFFQKNLTGQLETGETV